MSVLIPLTVCIQQHYPEASLPKSELWEQWFQQWVKALETELPVAEAYELTLCLSNNAEIQSLNANYRHKNEPTDVLAFASLETPFPQEIALFVKNEPLYLGDIIISVETAQQQAAVNGHSLAQELAWLATHGLLHLLGWDHPDAISLQKMLAYQHTLLTVSGHK